MRVLQLLTAALLPFTALAAKKSSGDRFADYHAKQLSSSGPVKLTDRTYNDLTKKPRDYSVAVLLTALEARFGCGLCNEFQPEWELLGRSWSRGDKGGESRLIYGTLDFADGRDTFQSVRSLEFSRLRVDRLTLLSFNYKRHPSCSYSTQRPDRTRSLKARLSASTSVAGRHCLSYISEDTFSLTL